MTPEKRKDRTVTKKDRLYGTLVIAGIFIIGFIVYFFDAIFYFFYLLFSGK